MSGRAGTDWCAHVCVCVCVRERERERERERDRACVRACVRVCVLCIHNYNVLRGVMFMLGYNT